MSRNTSEINKNTAIALLQDGKKVYVVDDMDENCCQQEFFTDVEEAKTYGTYLWKLASRAEKKGGREIMVYEGILTQDNIGEPTISDGGLFLHAAWKAGDERMEEASAVCYVRALGRSKIVTITRLTDEIGADVGDQVRVKISRIDEGD